MTKKSKTPKTSKAGKDTKPTKEPKDSKTTKQTMTRMLPCKLDEKEMSKLGQDLALTLDKIGAIEAQRKTANDQFKADTGLLEEALTRLRDKIRSKTEEREIECEQETDYLHGEVRVKRLDTGEVFSKRTLTKEEAQLPLLAQKPAGKLLAMDGGKGKVVYEACPECKGTKEIMMGEPPLPTKCEGCDGTGEVEAKAPLTASLADVAAQHAKNKADADAAAEEAPAQEGDGHPEVEKLIKARKPRKSKTEGNGLQVDTSHGPEESF